jgi:hypothetical protein
LRIGLNQKRELSLQQRNATWTNDRLVYQGVKEGFDSFMHLTDTYPQTVGEFPRDSQPDKVTE